MKLVGAWASEVGHVRSINEDSYLVDEALHVFAVADGVGGHRGGEVASSTAIETLRASLANQLSLEAAITASNRAVYERSMRDPELFGMGTTMTVAMPVTDHELQLGHVGDSRAYLCRDSRLRQITDDHSMVGELVRDGRITEEQASMHPQRNVITRAVGMEPTVDVDIVTIAVQNGDRVLLCSDGITDMLHDATIESLLASPVSAQECAEALADQALGNGGIDNLTAVVIDISEIDAAVSTEPPDNTSAAPAVTPLLASGASPPAAASVPLDSQVPVHVVQPGRGRVWSFVRLLLITVVPLAIVIGAIIGGLRYFYDRQWYVGEANGYVALYHGARDAPFGWKPARASVSATARVADIPDASLRARVAANKYCQTTSAATARDCFATIAKTTEPTTTTPSTTTTTSATRVTTTNRPTVKVTTSTPGGVPHT